ncbi:MAG: hypothetical protein ACK4MD_09135 [Demequina sp.]
MSNDKGQLHDTVALDIPNARGDVRVTGADRIFYKVLIDGQPVSRRRGGWAIPLRGGDTATLKARGFIPGFQTLYVDNRAVMRLGGHVGLPERMVMFLPLLLLIFQFPGLVLGLALFFMNVMAVKNPLMPRAVRIGLPIANTAAGVFVLLLLPSVIGL